MCCRFERRRRCLPEKTGKCPFPERFFSDAAPIDVNRRAKSCTPAAPLMVTAADAAYGEAPLTLTVPAGMSVETHWDVSSSRRWYDIQLTVAGNPGWLRRIVGHAEPGKTSPRAVCRSTLGARGASSNRSAPLSASGPRFSRVLHSNLLTSNPWLC